jgi:hypothetical protein
MAGLTLAEAQANLDAANAAYPKALEAESYNEGTRGLRRDPEKILEAIKHWDSEVRRLTARGNGSGGPTVRAATPV